MNELISNGKSNCKNLWRDTVHNFQGLAGIGRNKRDNANDPNWWQGIGLYDRERSEMLTHHKSSTEEKEDDKEESESEPPAWTL